MGGARSTHGAMRDTSVVGNPGGKRHHSEDLGGDWRIILGWFLGK